MLDDRSQNALFSKSYPPYPTGCSTVKYLIDLLIHSFSESSNRIEPKGGSSSSSRILRSSCLLFCMKLLSFGVLLPGIVAFCADPPPMTRPYSRQLASFIGRGRRSQYRPSTVLTVRLFSSSSSGYSDGSATTTGDAPPRQSRTEIPLIFVHGMKGAHLSSSEKRHWLSLAGLLNFPPRPDQDLDRDLSMPLTYGENQKQDTGALQPDGLVNHVIDFNTTWTSSSPSLQFLPFYGHVSKLMGELNNDYHRTKDDDGQSTGTAETANIDNDTNINTTSSFISRPTACFVYDWRRNLQELSDEFHEFCCDTFPDDPQVQVVAHSMGGLLTLGAMRRYPDKYRPGAVLVGVPFSTGIQYLQDLQLGYTTELGRCRQFQPSSQFTMSSHWSFFPRTDGVDRWEAKDEHAFVDVTDHDTTKFEANAPSIGIPVEDGFRLEPVAGTPISIDFYNTKDWEEHQIGIFDPQLQSGAQRCETTRAAYKEHMRIQFERAKEYRDISLRRQDEGEDIPPLVVCASNTEPTINQILRRKKQGSNKDESSSNKQRVVYEYDYKNGRSVPGDGRIHYAGAFPPVDHDVVPLQSAHAKQFLWETDGGNLQTIMNLVDDQILTHHHLSKQQVANNEKVKKDVEQPQAISQ